MQRRDPAATALSLSVWVFSYFLKCAFCAFSYGIKSQSSKVQMTVVPAWHRRGVTEGAEGHGDRALPALHFKERGGRKVTLVGSGRS